MVRRGQDRMVFGFITTYAICAHHHQCCEFEHRSYEVGGFLRLLRFPPPIKMIAAI